MKIDFTNNTILIEDINLETHQISQLKFWGFKNDGIDRLIFTNESVDGLILKLIAYFKKENLIYEVTDDLKSRITELNDNILKFKRIKNLGDSFKSGQFNSSEFQVFCQFFNTHLPSRKLKAHQLKAAFHLYLVHNGANFSVPGSGKTSVVLSVYEKLKEESKVNVLFVVGPPACFGPWKTEFFETLGRKPDFRILASGEKGMRKSEYYANTNNKAELYLTTFQTLLNDQDDIIVLFSQENINVFLVIDEAHYIKQLNGNWASAVLNIAKHSTFRCILTGTPIPKSFSDIYNLFDFLWPQNETIESSARIKLQTLEKSNKIDEAKEILENRVGSLFYRVRKKDLGLKEQVFHEPIVLSMNKYEKIIYEAIERKIRHYSMNDYLQNIDFINKLKRGRIIRLRQSVSYLHLLIKAIENYEENILEDENDLRYIVRDYDKLELPAKFEYLTKKVTALQKEKQKVVIWTNFVGTIEKLEKYFNKSLGMYCRSIYGKTPIEQSTIADEKTREEIRDEFVDSKSGLDILIANPAACAESISLHKTCHIAIYYDLTYNCAQYLQSLDRIHRVGGSEEIEAQYYFLQYENTIDQDILNNLRRKADRMSKIIDEDYRIYSLDMFDDEDEEINAYNRLFGKK